MGLLDTWNEWKQDLSPYAEKAKDKIYGDKMSVQPGQGTMRRTEQGYLDQSLKYAGGKIDQAQEAGAQYFQGEKAFDPATGGPTKRTGVQSSKSMEHLEKGLEKTSEYFHKGTKYAANKIEEKFNTMFPELAGKKVSKNEKQKLIEGYGEGKVDHGLVQGLKERNSPVNEKDIGTLEKLTGTSFADAKANWKDKGGMEGLMSNPAFSLGLALMQSSANGKTINQGILDNFVKSAKISSEFKDRIEARKEEPIQATAADISETKDLLKAMNIEEGNWFENFGSKVKSVFTGKGGNPGLEWDTAVEEISLQYQIKVKAAQTALKQAGKNQVLRKTDKIRIMNKLVEEQKIKRNKSMTGGLFTADTLKNPLPNRAQGGPVSQGQPYVVGEKGPEIIIPHSSGNVLSNDDSQIYAMLLASNPQLQKVSRQRAEKVLRNRFPEYFEG